MISLNSRESLFLRGVKLNKVYSFKYLQFEEFYKLFEDSCLYKRKTVIMAFYALYGNTYKINEVENIIIKDGINLLMKFQDINPDFNYYKNLLEYILGELAILPIGEIVDGKYIKKINIMEK